MDFNFQSLPFHVVTKREQNSSQSVRPFILGCIRNDAAAPGYGAFGRLRVLDFGFYQFFVLSVGGSDSAVSRSVGSYGTLFRNGERPLLFEGGARRAASLGICISGSD